MVVSHTPCSLTNYVVQYSTYRCLHTPTYLDGPIVVLVYVLIVEDQVALAIVGSTDACHLVKNK